MLKKTLESCAKRNIDGKCTPQKTAKHELIASWTPHMTCTIIPSIPERCFTRIPRRTT